MELVVSLGAGGAIVFFLQAVEMSAVRSMLMNNARRMGVMLECF